MSNRALSSVMSACNARQALQQGFTIIELIVTLLIIGIGALPVLPKFFQRQPYQERLFFDDTLNALRYARKLAVVFGCKVQVAIGSDSYTLWQPADSGQCLAVNPTFSLPVAHPGSGAASYTGSEPGITLTSTAANVVFDALGRASSDAVLTIAGVRTITIVGETGFVYDSTP